MQIVLDMRKKGVGHAKETVRDTSKQKKLEVS
jgi:hypothetical protein